jgi:hypothetical protein
MLGLYIFSVLGCQFATLRPYQLQGRAENSHTQDPTNISTPVLRKNHTEGNLTYNPQIVKTPKNSVFHAGCNLSKSYVPFKNLVSNYIYRVSWGECARLRENVP